MSKKPNKQKLHPACVNLYAIRDVKQPRFFAIFESPNHDVAIRQFTAQITSDDAKNMIAAAADFELWHLGDYDHVDGQIDPLPQNEFIVSGSEIVSYYVDKTPETPQNSSQNSDK